MAEGLYCADLLIMRGNDVLVILGLAAGAYYISRAGLQSSAGQTVASDNQTEMYGNVNYDPNVPLIDQNIVDYTGTAVGTINEPSVGGYDVNANDSQQAGNLTAFLWMIRCCEGTATFNDEGYRALVGFKPGNGITFTDFSRHPNIINAQFNSTAAGAYQIIYKTWASLCNQHPALFPLRDFSPSTQDRMAIQLIADHGALNMVYAGQFDSAVAQVNKSWTEWASLPSTKVSQGNGPKSLAFARAAYSGAGGVLS